MHRVLAGLFVIGLSGCQCGPAAGFDGGPDGFGNDAGKDAGRDAGPLDAGRDAGRPDAGDAGPQCSAELCDGVDNDCNGTIDLLTDGGSLSQPCALQLGTCQGARVQCQGGTFPACSVEYGSKYEEFESLCDGVDNDCSGVVDVSQWRPIAEVGADPSFAVSVPGGWYVATGLNAQLFDEQLRPTSVLFPVGRAGAASFVSATGISFGGYLNQLFTQLPVPGATYLRRLNLDGTYVTLADGGPLEIDLAPGHTAPIEPGALRASNDRSTLLVTFGQQGAQQLLTLWPDGGTRAPLTTVGNAGAWSHEVAAVGAEDFVVAVPSPTGLQLQRVSADLLPLGGPVDLTTPGSSSGCVVSTHTTAVDAGADWVVAVCPDSRRLYAAQNLFTGGALTPFWEADAGVVSHVRVLPSYARATVFWMHAGASATIWMSQVDGLPTSIAELRQAPVKLDVAASIRGGYLLEAVFDGGQGLRPYGAYVCPL